jgi:hypothetical protein
MPFSGVLGEVIELLQEVKKRSWTGIRSEFWDVYSCVFEYLYHTHGLDLLLFDNPSTRAWTKRFFWWKVWLGAHCLEFHSSYMIYGGNFRRREKRHRVLQMAKEEQK